MAHEHKLEKIKSGSSFDCDSAYLILENVSNRTIVVAGVSLYPKDRAWYCSSNDKVDKFIKDNKLKVVETHQAKPKTRKIKEEKLEESSLTVADTESEASVQLSSSEDDIAPSIEQ